MVCKSVMVRFGTSEGVDSGRTVLSSVRKNVELSGKGMLDLISLAGAVEGTG